MGVQPGLRRSQKRVLANDSLQHAFDIAVDHGDGLREGNAGDGGGSVASDAGESLKSCGGLRELAAEVLDEFSGALMHHAGAAIVAEATPSGEHGVFGGGREGVDVGEKFEENPVMVEHGGDAGLLQHDFAEPDAIGIVGVAPGKIAAMLVVPAEKGATESD